MQLLLDLDDNELFLEGPELEKALSRLDADGWDTSNRLHRSSWKRVWYLHCIVREDIIELALGTATENLTLRAR